MVARIVLQDFTGVPLLVDLAAMRSAVAKLGKNPKIIEPLVPVDLVVDHSVQVDFAGGADSMARNLDLEFTRNRERYQFLKWGMQAFDTFKVVPPGIGIVHQVNLEYLAKGVLNADGVYYPDTLVGTDSHTTMINGLGIVGWGVGGIEAEAGMLGQPVYFLTPDVVGVHMTGAIREGVTATDVALTVTQMLRKAKVVGKFVEFFGPGAAALPLVDRATIANMAPEYGATMGFFPIDAECANYLRATGRSEEAVKTYENYYRAQGLWGIPKKGDIAYSQEIELDLATVLPSVAGPKRPQDRIELPKLKQEFITRLQQAGHGKWFWHEGRRIVAHGACLGRRRNSSRRRQPAGNGQCRPANGKWPPNIPRPIRFTPRAATGRQRAQRLGAHRGHHQLHQHQQSDRDARRRFAREKSRRTRPHGQFHRQGVARARLARRQRLSEQDRPAAVSGQARFQPRRLRLHDVHRQFRPAASGHRGRGRQKQSGRRVACFPATAISRRACTRTSRRISSCRRRSSSRSRSRAAWTLTWPTTRSAPARMASPFTCATSGRACSEVRDLMQAALQPEVFRKLYKDFAAQNPKWNEIPSSTGNVYEWDRQIHLHPGAAVLREFLAAARQHHSPSTARARWPFSATA